MAWTAKNSEGYEAPVALATDVVVMTVRDRQLLVLSVPREDGPRALPGGFVGPRESAEQTARRKLREKTGLRDIYLEQLATFAEPGRDPRGWIPSVAHLALVPPATTQSDPGAEWIPAHGRHRLAFDHRRIVREALGRLQGKLWWSNVAVGVLPSDFTMTEAREVYEAVAGRTYDPATFARDLKATGLIDSTGRRREHGRGRPATLYRFRGPGLVWGAGRRKRINYD